MPEASKTPTPGPQLFRDVFNASPIGIVVENLDGQPLFANPSFCAFLGLSEEELHNKHCVDFSPPEDAAKDWALFQQLRAGLISHYQLEKRYFRGDGSLVWGNLSISLLNSHPSPLVIAMVDDITAKKTAEEALIEVNRVLETQASVLQSREELLRIFVKNVPAAVAMLDREMRYLQVSDRWCTDYLSGRERVVGRSHYDLFPDMPERWKEVHHRGLQGETLRADEDRWDGQDGPHWARWEVRPWKTPEGTVGGILILAEDITRRKQMEEAVSHISKKLIQSQEQERARIGRELHDDINQRLAMLAVELERLQDDPSEFQKRVRQLRKQTAEISNDVQALSHDLHAWKLEYLGAVAGMRSWCREFGDRQGMEINFKTDVTSSIPTEIGLTLFRISQEALHNAVKHSGVKRIEVQLSEHSNEIHLTISDAGKGFDTGAKPDRGLGLASMEERVRLVKGTIAIDSKPMRGTSIRIRIPFTAEQATQRAAG
jgi:PAS domain S-box-containing protein